MSWPEKRPVLTGGEAKNITRSASCVSPSKHFLFPPLAGEKGKRRFPILPPEEKPSSPPKRGRGGYQKGLGDWRGLEDREGMGTLQKGAG